MIDEIEYDEYLEICCYLCKKLLRDVNGKDVDDIHTDSDGNDVCEDCCDICNSEYQDEYGYDDEETTE